MKISFFSVLIFGLLLHCLVSGAASVSIIPVSLSLQPDQKITSFKITNQTGEATVFQTSAVTWQQKNGKDIESPTNDLIITPPIVTIAPYAEQIIRIGIRHQQDFTKENTYRIVLQQILTQDTPAISLKNTVRVLLKINIPLFIVPLKEIRDISWDIKRINKSQLALKVFNKGNANAFIDSIKLKDANGNELELAQNIVGRVLGGDNRTWTLQLSKPFTENTVNVNLTTEWQGKDKEIRAVVPIT